MKSAISPSLCTTQRILRAIALPAIVIAGWGGWAAPASAQLPPICIPGVPIPGLCPPTSTPAPTATPNGTTTPGTTPTANATGSPTGSPTVNPEATPVAGGSITIVAQSDVHGVDGEAVDAGQFRIRNTSDATETISEIRVEVTEPAMFSSLTLTADGQAVTITDPAEENSFFFDPEVQIAPGESIDVTLSAEIGQTSSGTSSPTPETSTTPSGTTTPSPTPTNTPSSTIASLAGRGPQGPQSPPPSSPTGKRDRFPHSGATALLAVALACAALASRSRRLGFVVSILLIALYAGCGSEQTSSQTVAGITASNGSGPVTMDGLPASLGTVSRPQPLLFPGAKK